jgi:hypothetical protein
VILQRNGIESIIRRIIQYLQYSVHLGIHSQRAIRCLLYPPTASSASESPSPPKCSDFKDVHSSTHSIDISRAHVISIKLNELRAIIAFWAPSNAASPTPTKISAAKSFSFGPINASSLLYSTFCCSAATLDRPAPLSSDTNCSVISQSSHKPREQRSRVYLVAQDEEQLCISQGKGRDRKKAEYFQALAHTLEPQFSESD